MALTAFVINHMGGSMRLRLTPKMAVFTAAIILTFAGWPAATARAQTAAPGAFLLPEGQELQATSGSVDLDSEENRRFFEQIDDFSDGSRFRKLAAGVGRLEVLKTGAGDWTEEHCTASLLSDQYVLTAYHCLLDLGARGLPRLALDDIRLRLGFVASDVDNDTGADGEVWHVALEPVEFSEVAALDYAILEIVPAGDQPAPTSQYDPVKIFPLVPDPGAELFVIHHPQGVNQRVTARDCRVVPEDDEELSAMASLPVEALAHRCDTLPGSSGAPIFVDQFNVVVALHHAGIRRTGLNFAKRLTAIVDVSEVLAAIALPARPLTVDELEARNEAAVDQAISSAENLIETMIERFAGRQGVQSADILLLLEDAREQVDGLAEQFGQSNRLLLNRADLSVQFADIYRTLRDLDQQRRAIDDALAILQMVLADDAKNVPARISLVQAQSRLARLHVENGDPIEAFRLDVSSLALVRELTAERPDLAGRRLTEAELLTSMSSALRISGNFADAQRAINEGRVILDILSEVRPGNPDVVRVLAFNLVGLSSLREVQGNLEEALAARQDSNDLFRQFVAADPLDVQASQSLAQNLAREAELLERLSRPRDALETFGEAAALLMRLGDADPSNAQLLRNRAIVMGNTGRLAREQGDLDRSIDDHRVAMGLWERLIAIEPAEDQHHRGRADMLGGLARAQLQSGRAREAVGSLTAAADLRRDIARRNPTNATDLRAVVIETAMLGVANVDSGNRRAAQQNFDAARVIAAALADANPAVAVLQDDVVWIDGLLKALR